MSHPIITEGGKHLKFHADAEKGEVVEGRVFGIEAAQVCGNFVDGLAVVGLARE